MKVIEIKPVEDCFDGSAIKELLLSEKITKDLIFKLGEGGETQYFPHFARPFFKIRRNGLYDLKGIVGNPTLRIHLKNPKAYSLDEFIEMVSSL